MANLEERIKEAIRSQGPMTFALFMEMALFDPKEGYYTSAPEPVGGKGDYYTSPTAHPAFAALVGLQLEQMWRILDCPAPFYIAEAGAGRGLLARDILGYLPHLSADMAQATRYIAIDRRPSVAEAPGLERVLGTDVPLRQVTGCFLCNELMDVLPCHRVTQRGGRLLEVYVGLNGDKLADVIAEPSTPKMQQLLESEGIHLPDGYVTEVNLEAPLWTENAARSLARGFILSVDYGYVARERLSSEWSRGSITTYYQHTVGDDPYIRIGRQDITSHVDFTSLVFAGNKNGLSCEGVTSQRRFLLNLGLDSLLRALAERGLNYQHYLANHMAMQDLVRPEGPGGFKVLIQSKAVDAPALRGLTQNSEAASKLASLPVPLLDEAHVSLLAAKYPDYFVDMGEDELTGKAPPL